MQFLLVTLTQKWHILDPFTIAWQTEGICLGSLLVFTLFTKATPSMYNLISEATYFTNVLSSTQGLGFRLEIW